MKSMDIASTLIKRLDEVVFEEGPHRYWVLEGDDNEINDVRRSGLLAEVKAAWLEGRGPSSFTSTSRSTLEWVEYTSMTTFIKSYAPPFPKYDAARGCATDKWLVEDVLRSWEYAGEFGTINHAFAENRFLGREPDEILDDREPEYRKAIDRCIDTNIRGKYEIVIPELIVYSKLLKIAGSIDALLLGRDFDMLDWKTNETLKTWSKKNYFAPINHVPNCHIYDYSIQQYGYEGLLARILGPKFTLNNRWLAHVRPAGVELIQCKNMAQEVGVLFEDRTKKIRSGLVAPERRPFVF